MKKSLLQKLNSEFERCSLNQLEQGIKLCTENARSLFEEAQILQKARKYARAYSLAQICNEEIGKAIILLNHLINTCNNGLVNSITHKEFADHIEKTRRAISLDFFFLQFLKESEQNSDIFEKNLYKELNSIAELNLLKNDSLYVNIINGEFYSPLSKFDNDLVIQYQTKVSRRFAILIIFIEKWISDPERFSTMVKNI